MRFLYETNPLFFLGAFVALLLMFGLLRSHWREALSGLAVAFFLFLLLSPGGRDVSGATARIPDIADRGRCLLDSVSSGAVFSGELPGSCDYPPPGFRSRR